MKFNKSGHRIRIARMMQERRWTQDELAEQMCKAGIIMSKNTLSRIELGQRYVTDLELITFAKILQVSTAWLLEESNCPSEL